MYGETPVGILPTRVANYVSSLHLSSKLTKIPKAPCYEDEVCVVNRLEVKSIKAIQIIKEYIINSFV